MDPVITIRKIVLFRSFYSVDTVDSIRRDRGRCLFFRAIMVFITDAPGFSSASMRNIRWSGLSDIIASAFLDGSGVVNLAFSRSDQAKQSKICISMN